VEAVTTGWIDRGGPLFVLHPESNRYTVIGVSRGRMGGDWTGHIWSYLGNAGDGNPAHDHAPALLPQISTDLDADGVPDAGDNCNPHDCLAASYPSSASANPDPRETLGIGSHGDVCCCLWGDVSNRNGNQPVEDDLQARRIPDNCDP